MQTATHNTKKHVLLTDDEEHTRVSLSLLLRKAGYRVTVARDGREALDVLHNQAQHSAPIDLLILDIQMPRLSGCELLETLVNEDIVLPVVVITSFGTKDLLVDLLHKGCTGYIDKPFSGDELCERVKSALEKFDRQQAEHDRIGLRRSLPNARLLQASRCADWTEIGNEHPVSDNRRQNLGRLADAPIPCEFRASHHQARDYIAIQCIRNGYDVLLASMDGAVEGAEPLRDMIADLFSRHNRAGYNGMTFLKVLNEFMLEHGSQRMLSAIFLRIILTDLRATVVMAGQPCLVHFKRDSCLPEWFRDTADVLGRHKFVDLHEYEMTIHPGDRLYMVTRSGDWPAESEHCADVARGWMTACRDQHDGELAAMIDMLRNWLQQQRAIDDFLLAGLVMPNEPEQEWMDFEPFDQNQMEFSRE